MSHSQIQALEAPAGAPQPTALADTRELLWLALPMIGVAISRMAMGFIDFVMVSVLGTTAQAAISPATLFVFALGCLGMGVSQAVQTFVSQSDGRGEQQNCGGYAWATLYIALASTAITAPLILTIDVWFLWLGQLAGHPPEALAQEIAYLEIGLWSIGPMTLCMGLENFFNGIRRPSVTLLAVISSMVANAVGNYLLIYGPHLHWVAGGITWIEIDFPEMGIAGAALATVLAWMLRVLILSAALLSREIDARYNTRRSYAFDSDRLRQIVRVGGPTAVQWLVDIGAWVVFLQVMMPPLGVIPLAASNIAIQFMHLSFMPALGIGQAMTSQVGFAIGAGDPDRAMRRVMIARLLIVGYMSAAAVLFVLAGGPLADLLCFEQDAAVRASVIAAAAAILIWVAAFQVGDALCIVYSFAARGAGDTRVPAILFAWCCWGVFVLGGLLVVKLAPQLGFHGPWMMCTAYILLLGALLMRRFHSQKWRAIRLFEKSASGVAEAT